MNLIVKGALELTGAIAAEYAGYKLTNKLCETIDEGVKNLKEKKSKKDSTDEEAE